MIGWRNKRTTTTASSFQTILRPAACFLRTRTIVPIMSRSNTRSVIKPYALAALAAESTSSQSLVQMSEP